MISQSLTSQIYISVLAISLICFYLSFRYNYSKHLKILSVLIAVTFIVEWFAVFGIKKIFHYNNNTEIYNVFMLVEFWVFAYYYKLLFQSKLLQKIAAWFLYIFPVFWFIVVFFVFGISAWNSYLIVAGSFFTVCFSAAYYYELFTSPKLVKLTSTPEFWIATGMIIFYTCELPYMGMLNFLVEHFLSLARNLLPVLTILATVMYLFFIYAYICGISTKK